jgi:hypothetical protein
VRWQEVFKTRFPKQSDAATELHRAWSRVEPKKAKSLKDRSLAARISKLLAHGDSTGWWRKNSELARCFSDLLGLDESAVFGGAPVPDGMLAFPEFPLLQPIAPREEPCRLGKDGWLLNRVLRALDAPGRGREAFAAWITAPAGSGKSLVVRYLRARAPGDIEATSVLALDNAAPTFAIDLPLVIEVEEAASSSDLRSMVMLLSRPAPTVVLSPFPIPGAPSFGARQWARATGWTTADAAPTGFWRERMVAWIVERLEARERRTKLVKEEVLEWLERHDPTGDLVATPGDVLALCSDFDLHGGDGATMTTRARRWLDRVGVMSFPGEVPGSWRKHVGAKAFASLGWSHAQDTASPLGSLDGKAWSAHVSASVAPGTRGRSPGAHVVVGYLLDAGLVRGGSGGLVQYPRWVASSTVAEDLIRMFEKGSVSAWGALAADETRRHLVDLALDVLSDQALRGLVRQLAQRPPPRSLTEIAVMEATVAALGRRLAKGGLRLSDNEVAAAQRLMLQQIDALVLEEGYGEVHHPLTRPALDEWFLTGWAVSLRVPAPHGFSRDDLAWELPGWSAQLSLASIPRHGFPGSTVIPWGATKSVATMGRLAVEVVRQLERTELSPDVARLLLPALFLSPADWPLDQGHLEQLHGAWEEQILAQQAAELLPHERASLARRIWTLIGRAIVDDARVPVAERIEFLRTRHPHLSRLVLSNLELSELASTARRDGIHRRASKAGYHPSDPRALLELSNDGRREAIRGWLESATERGARFDEARELVPLLCPEDIDLAIEVAGKGDREIAAEFTDYVWMWDPERACEEARFALKGDLASVEGWFHRAPRVHLPFLAGLIAGQEPVPRWATKWAKRRMLDGGKAAEQLYELARREQ